MPGLDHMACRRRVCVCCGDVIKSKEQCVLSQIEEERVKLFAHAEFSREVESYPLGLDPNCKRHLRRLSEAAGGRAQVVSCKDLENKWKRFKLENLKMSRAVPHDCTVCNLVKTNPVLGSPSQANTKKRSLSDEDQGKENKRMKSESVCKVCLQVTGRGIPHKCTETARKGNIVKLFSKEPLNGQGQVLSGCIKSFVQDNNLEAGDSMKLNGLHGGQKLNVKAGVDEKSKKPPTLLDESFYSTVQKKLTISTAKVKDLKYLLNKANAKSVPYVREKLVDMGREMEEFYDVARIEMEEEKSEVKQVLVEKMKIVNKQKVITIEKKEKKETVLKKVMKDVDYVKDPEKFVNFIAEKRNIDKKDLVVRTSLDGGGGSFKVVANIFKMPEADEKPEGKKGDLDTGANKLIVLGLVENMQERYENVRQLLELLQLNKIKENFCVMDLKVNKLYFPFNTSIYFICCFSW